MAELERDLCACVPYSAVAICVLHLSLCSIQCSGHLDAASVPMLHSVQWPHLCYICPYAPFSAVAISMLHLSLRSIQCSGHFYVTSVPMFHTVQWPSLCCTCPYVPCSSVAIAMLHLSLCSVQFSGNLYDSFSAVTICLVPLSIYSMQCICHLYGASVPTLCAVQWPTTSVVPLPMLHTAH
jgi:hypothetical protein